MRLHNLVIFLLCVSGGARRSKRIASSHQNAHQQNNILADGLEVSAEANEFFVPGTLKTSVSQPSVFQPARPRPVAMVAWSENGPMPAHEYDGAAAVARVHVAPDAQSYDQHLAKQAAIGERATLSTEGWETMHDSMDSMRNTLQEMTSSPEKLKESLERSPYAMHLAEHVPAVAALLAHPDDDVPQSMDVVVEQMQEVAMDLAQSMDVVVEQMQEDLDEPARRTEAIRTMESVLTQFAAAAQDPVVQELLVDMAEAEGEEDKAAVAVSMAQLADSAQFAVNIAHGGTFRYTWEDAPGDWTTDEAETEAAIEGALQRVNAARARVPMMVAKAGGKKAVVAKKPPAKRPAAKSPAASPTVKKPAAKRPAARKPAAKRPAAKKPVPKRTASRAVNQFGPSPIKEGDIGVLNPTGIWDPLNLMNKMPDKYRRWQEMEIKHGRFAMAAVTHVLVTGAGVRWPGYLSYAEDIKFTDMPGGTLASWEALPGLAWAQIVLVVALLDNSILAQDPNKAPGDVAPIPLGPFKAPDVEGPSGRGFTRAFKLNAERSNGRLAMMGIIGMIVNEALTGNPVYPFPMAPQPVLSAVAEGENGPEKIGSFLLASTGMAFVGGLGAFNQFKKDGEFE